MSSRRSPLLALPRLPRGRSWSLAALVGLLVAFEAVGRFAPNDWADGLVLALLALGTTLALRPRGADLWAIAEARLHEWTQRNGFDIGIDLRREPELSRGTPRLVARTVWLGLGFLLVQAVLLLTLRPNLRPFLQSFFYSAWLALLAALWAGIVLGIGLSLLLLSQLLRDELLRARRRGRISNLGGALALATAVVLLLASARWILPTWIPGAVIAGSTLLLLARLRFGAAPSLDLLWRERRGGPIRAVPWRGVLALRNGLLALAALAIDLSARGGAAIGLGAESAALEGTPLTYLLGTLFAWLAAAAIALQTRSDLRDLAPEFDPSQPQPLSLHAAGAALARERERLAALCRRLGWLVRFAPAKPRSADVQVELVEKKPPLRTRRWPLALSPTALELPELQEIVRRRDVVQRRRALLRGLKRLWKALGRASRNGGGGVLLAPQYWFFVGMTRDGQDAIALGGPRRARTPGRWDARCRSTCSTSRTAWASPRCAACCRRCSSTTTCMPGSSARRSGTSSVCRWCASRSTRTSSAIPRHAIPASPLSRSSVARACCTSSAAAAAATKMPSSRRRAAAATPRAPRRCSSEPARAEARPPSPR